METTDKKKEEEINTKGAVTTPSSSSIIEFDTETFNLSSERAELLTATRPQGTAAKGYTEKVAKSLDDAKDKIKKKYFGNNKELGDEWERGWLEHRNKKVNDAYQYEVAQVIHGAKIDNDALLSRQFSAIAESFDMANVAAYFLTGATIEASGDKYAVRTSNMSLRNEENPIDHNDPNKEAEQESRAKEKLEAVEDRNKDVANAQAFFNGKIDLARESASEILAKLHRGQYDHAVNVLGYSPDAAGAFANDQIRKNMKKTLQDIVSTNPESAKKILSWLARPDATKVQEVDDKGKPSVDAEGKPIYSKTKWHPLGRWCLSSGDVAELAASAEHQLQQYIRTQQFKSASSTEAFKLKNANIRMRADQLALQPILDIDEMNMLFKETAELGKSFAGAAETSAYLRGIVEKAERKYSRAQKMSEDLKTDEEFEQMYKIYQTHEKTCGTLFYGLAKDDGRKELVRAESIDGQNLLRLVIRNGITRGVLKGERWTERLKKLESSRAMEDSKAMISAVYNLGITVDEKKTKSLWSAMSDGYRERLEEKGSSSMTPMWNDDKFGTVVNGVGQRLRLTNPSSLMFNWTTASGHKVTFTGDELNNILAIGEKWQMRHINPSPSGANGVDTKELENFLGGVLEKAAKDKMVITHWYSSDENRVASFSDIVKVGLDELEDYYSVDSKDGKVYNKGVYTGKDLSYLEGVVYDGSLPSMTALRRIFDRKVTEQK